MLDAAPIAHIPLRFRRQLVRAVTVLFEEFEEAQKGKLADKSKAGRILRVRAAGRFRAWHNPGWPRSGRDDRGIMARRRARSPSVPPPRR